MPKRERILCFDFMRTVCAFCIMIYHFFVSLSATGYSGFFSYIENTKIPFVTVKVFFMLSGALLFYNNSDIGKPKFFYYKRFKSIYPMFYIAFIPCFAVKVIMENKLFYAGNPLKLLLSLFGIDGYFFLVSSQNYHQVGEWFLGAIIFIYILYPLILKLYKKSALLTFTVVFGLYAIIFIKGLFTVDTSINILSCLASFFMGIIIIDNKDILLENKFSLIISAVVFMLLLTDKLPFIPYDIIIFITAICVFIIFSFIGKAVMKSKLLCKIFTDFSTISYAFFLVQHKVAMAVVRLFNPSNLLFAIFGLLLCTVVTVISAKVLYVITDRLLKTKLYINFENRIFNKTNQRIDDNTMNNSTNCPQK